MLYVGEAIGGLNYEITSQKYERDQLANEDAACVHILKFEICQ
jgi:hypothetical protein